MLLVISVTLAVNTYRLHRKRERGEMGSWDGFKGPVKAFDVLLSAALCVAALAAGVYEWLRAG